jgi:hypothetical protein
MQYIPVGAEVVGLGADDLEELSEDDSTDYFKLGAEDGEEEFKDYAGLALKPDHANRCRCLQFPTLINGGTRTAEGPL